MLRLTGSDVGGAEDGGTKGGGEQVRRVEVLPPARVRRMWARVMSAWAMDVMRLRGSGVLEPGGGVSSRVRSRRAA